MTEKKITTIPTPPVMVTYAAVYEVKPYPLRLELDMILRFAAEDWDALPWWRRLLARWASGYDWGVALRNWAELVPVSEENRTQCVMRSREELAEMYSTIEQHAEVGPCLCGDTHNPEKP